MNIPSHQLLVLFQICLFLCFCFLSTFKFETSFFHLVLLTERIEFKHLVQQSLALAWLLTTQLELTPWHTTITLTWLCVCFPLAACSILGMSVFGGKFCARPDGTPCSCQECSNATSGCVSDRANFDSLLWSLVTVFQVSPAYAHPPHYWTRAVPTPTLLNHVN